MELTINPPFGGSVSQQLGFNARACIIQNLTPYWWYIPQAQHYVPPLVVNHIVSLVGQETGDIVFASPPGVPQVDSTNAANQYQRPAFRFIEDGLSAASGFVGFSGVPSAAKLTLPAVQLTAFITPLPALPVACNTLELLGTTDTTLRILTISDSHGIGIMIEPVVTGLGLNFFRFVIRRYFPANTILSASITGGGAGATLTSIILG